MASSPFMSIFCEQNGLLACFHEVGATLVALIVRVDVCSINSRSRWTRWFGSNSMILAIVRANGPWVFFALSRAIKIVCCWKMPVASLWTNNWSMNVGGTGVSSVARRTSCATPLVFLILRHWWVMGFWATKCNLGERGVVEFGQRGLCDAWAFEAAEMGGDILIFKIAKGHSLTIRFAMDEITDFTRGKVVRLTLFSLIGSFV